MNENQKLIDLIHSHLSRDLVVHTAPDDNVGAAFIHNGLPVAVATFPYSPNGGFVVTVGELRLVLVDKWLHEAFLASRKRFLESPEIQKAVEDKFMESTLQAITKALNL